MAQLTNRDINYLGALLHDIGKLIWRSQEIKAGEHHEKLGEEFIRQYLGKINCLSEDIEEIINAANRRRGKIWKADIIAAEEREDSEDKSPRRYLECITNRVDLNYPNIKSKSENYWYYYPKKLSLDKEENFPFNSNKKLQDYIHDDVTYIHNHITLLNDFIVEIDKLRSENNFLSFRRTFYKLLEKYTSRVLSAGYLSHPDISLFDHSRITAALSVCYEEGEENKECLLIKGDIAGIQNYIYNGIREMTDIAKRLRGRSFTIQLLTEVLSNYFIDKLNLFEANLIYNGGGHFLILSPNNKITRELINRLNSEINNKLLNRYSSQISLVLEFIECSGQEFINDFRNIYHKLDSKLNEAKKQKFRNSLNLLFQNQRTAKEYRNIENIVSNEEKRIGEFLPKTKYLLFGGDVQKFNENNNVLLISFPEFECFVFLCKDIESIEYVISLAQNKNLFRIISINNTNFMKDFEREIFKNVSKEFRFLGNNVPTRNNGQIISFEELAEMHSKNYPLLGIMRMDVDNLGAVFAFGLRELIDSEKKYTPSRVAFLSRELNWFFTGYINELAKEYDIYIAYSGGDDVFVVGNWYKIIKFAEKLRKEFRCFVCNNDNLSVSAGIIFTKANFPISQSALLAGEQEKLAKDTIPTIEKNKVGIFDIQLTWDEFSEFIVLADELSDFIESDEGKKIIPRSFLYTIYSITSNIFNNRGAIDFRKLSKAKAILHYLFARRKVTSSIIEQENKGKMKVEDLLYKLALRLLLSKDKEKEYKKIKFPLTVVLYKTRR